ncbi:ABC transporter ATP-binding protein/permease [uncultured Mobiluncus sp.]|uniref:ABC transporter ATP-binding protein/permease n=1 Tax=uncultured Mobiluncus sp. TaxID=293425 RepID=UPI0025E81FBB|nr:ATP-binding cassette domain-containing protein [uncultured Mobiluncus sp.]
MQTAAGRRANRVVLGLFWLMTLGLITVFVAAGEILDFYLHPEWSFPATIYWVSAIAGIVLVFGADFLLSRRSTRSQICEENHVRKTLLTQSFRAGPARMNQESAGKVVALATESAEKFTRYRQGFLPQVQGSFSAPVLIVAAMGIFVHPFLALLLVLCLPLAAGTVWLFQKLFRRSSAKSARARAALAANYLEVLQGLTTLQLLGAADRIGDKLETVGEENRRATMSLLRSNQVIIFVLDTVFSLFVITSVAALSMYLVSLGEMTLGKVVTALGLAMLLLEPIDHFGAFFYIAMGGRGAGRAISGFIHSRASHSTASCEDVSTIRPGEAEVMDEDVPVGDTEIPVVYLENVGVCYGSHEVLQGVNLKVSSGERVAIVGDSGQGKTTLLNVMKGFLTPHEGRVEVAGKTADLVRRSALVSQNTWLFTGTVRKNLQMAAPQASDTELWDALRAAHLDAEIQQMPLGLDTVVGENGIGLSSGQKQRLSLARALGSGRKLLLLDEATSQVDLNSERKILEALQALGRDYTLIMVSHRGALTALADRVLLVANGKLVER